MEKIGVKVAEIEPRIIELRRDIHQHPELSNREERTAKLVADRLRKLKVDTIQEKVAKHGVVALIHGKKSGASGVVALRADMDALPIEEKNSLPFCSKNKGVMHACGHDAHTAVLLGVAEVLCSLRDEFSGTVKLIFQPAEEGAPVGEEGGADLMVKDGVLDNPRPSAVLGLHVRPSIPVGKMGWVAGTAMASSDRFKIIVRGKGCHGAYPHLGVDAIYVAAQCVDALQSVRSRTVEGTTPMVLTIGKIEGGIRENVIADTVVMSGTLRAHSDKVRLDAIEKMKRVLAGVTAAHDASYELSFDRHLPVTHNDHTLMERLLPLLRASLGESFVVPEPAKMGAEDFSYFARELPSAFLFLGIRNEEKGIKAGLHTPEFDLDERCLAVGVKAMSSLAIGYLNGEPAQKQSEK